MDTIALETAPSRVSRIRWISVVVPLLIFVSAFTAAWFRLPENSRDTFWAEDAKTFSLRVLEPGLLPWSVFTSYDGYVHALPQSVAFVLWHVLPIPVELMAQAFTAAACVIAAAVAASIYLLTASWGLNVAGRLVLAFTTVLVPGLSFEVLGNLANVHWLLLWLAPFVFLARPTRWWTSVLLGLGTFVILTSEVQSVLFTPLLLWRLRDRRRWPMVAGALSGAIIQLVAVLGGGRSTWGDAVPRPTSVLTGYLLQVPLTGLTGSGESASAIVAISGWRAAFAALIPFILVALWWAWGSRRRALLAVAVFAASFAIWTAGYALNLASMIDFPSLERDTLLAGVPLLRYAIVPLMLLFALAGLAIGAQRMTRRTLESAVAVALVVLCAAAFIVGYRVNVQTSRMAGPTWTAGLAAAEAECAGADTDDRADIWVAPWEYWRFPVRCEVVQEWTQR